MSVRYLAGGFANSLENLGFLSFSRIPSVACVFVSQLPRACPDRRPPLRPHVAEPPAAQPQRRDSFTPDTIIARDRWAPQFTRGDQQCVGEAFTLLADALHAEDFNDVAHLVSPANAESVKATTVAAEHFQVCWNQTRCCLNPACQDAHVQTSKNFGLQLELPPSKVTVLELLVEHFDKEHVDDFVCERCRVRGPCEVSKSVTRWPPVLVLHVKRFRQDALGRLRKITEQLFFEENLDCPEFGVTYSLQAVAVHKGPFGTGHYVAFVRDSRDQWVHVNDSAPPVPVPFAHVQRSQAYLLVFRKAASA